MLEENRHGQRVLVQGRLLGVEATGLPGNPSLPVDDAFASYYQRDGGLDVFGYPLGPALVQDVRRMQYFERARLEENPTFDPNRNDPVWEVLRGRLAAE